MSEKRGKLLVVHSHERARTALLKILEAWGYEVDAAENGEEGLRKVRESRPHAIFCDLNSHGLPCLELLKAVRAEFPQIKFIITGTEMTCEHGKQLGASYCLRAPMAHSELVAALSHCLGHSPSD